MCHPEARVFNGEAGLSRTRHLLRFCHSERHFRRDARRKAQLRNVLLPQLFAQSTIQILFIPACILFGSESVAIA
jgi:hypothetical protein